MRGFKIGSSGAAISAPVINSCISTGGAEGLNIGANVVDAVIVNTNITRESIKQFLYKKESVDVSVPYVDYCWYAFKEMELVE